MVVNVTCCEVVTLQKYIMMGVKQLNERERSLSEDIKETKPKKNLDIALPMSLLIDSYFHMIRENMSFMIFMQDSFFSET